MRYALYFTPPEHDPLSRAAAHWLGRDPFDGSALPTPEVEGFDAAEMADVTAEPRRYGFHATLKPPFALAAGRSEGELVDALGRFCGQAPTFTIPSAVIGQLGHFFALVPEQPFTPLQAFAAEIVEVFEPYRAPLTDADMARRKPETLSETERANLVRWGYPYVMDEFRFHMTLTGPVKAERATAMRDLLNSRFADFVGRPLSISGLALYVEKERGMPFTIHSWLPLSGA
ncbi:DUF1045 domain-containing protein [Ciceribacter thiooxidans]|uniref:DUF1045 domain-containing protein n=1 Tax=Ciceribacter thiooxidans TaxID=1969821 RepID=A0ABV7I213_9HYPH|nr:DUF1045 domain-containing protein [Ciceribacter thiooxidans]